MSLHTYKCPNCSGGVNFNPETQGFTCEFCDSQFSKEEVEGNRPKSTSQPKKIEDETSEMAHYECPHCGAEVVTEKTTAATHCFYCHSSVVLTHRLSGDFKPDTVIPFAIEEKKAKEGIANWIGKKKFLPKGFACKRQLDKMVGVYFPVWYVDSEVEGSLNATGTKVKTWKDADFNYEETSFFEIERQGSAQFENMVKPALDKAESKLYKSVLPFDVTAAKPYNPAFLSGFQAEKRNIDSESHQVATEIEVKNLTADLLEQSVKGYREVTDKNHQSQLKSMKWKYTLLPVWTVTYIGTNQNYHYVMNGQTGKVSGKLPINNLKLNLTSLVVTLIVFTLLILVNGGDLG